MPIRTALWKVGPQPQALMESSLAKEQLLEDMIVAAPSVLSEEWMLIGRQEDTGLGGRVDLLAIAPDASLVLIELKRDRTPRDVVAQSLDYASWVQELNADDIAAIYGRFAPGRSLHQDFLAKFGQELDDDSLNDSHEIVVVAGALDASSERIIAYLSERKIPINVLCFQVFTNGTEQLLSRAWLIDPLEVQVNAATTPKGPKEPWNGEFYCSFGDSASRSWKDAVELGFISGGGGPWFSRTLTLLNQGDRIWVNVPGRGYVGVGRVAGAIHPAESLTIPTPKGDLPFFEVAKRANYHRESASDPERCEWVVPVRWLQTVSLAEAVHETGFFGNQNTVCKPTAPKWRTTVERLKIAFPAFDRVLQPL